MELSSEYFMYDGQSKSVSTVSTALKACFLINTLLLYAGVGVSLYFSLRPAVKDERATVLLPQYINSANTLMKAWMLGDRATYTSMCAPTVRMSIPSYGVDVTGSEAIWAIRVSMVPTVAYSFGRSDAICFASTLFLFCFFILCRVLEC
jgi:hypothetical protein